MTGFNRGNFNRENFNAPEGETPRAYALFINGEDCSAYLQAGSVMIEDDLGSRNTASFELQDTTGTFRPLMGQHVAIVSEGTRTDFGGTIDHLREREEDDDQTLFYVVDCVDYCQLADRFTVAEVYEDMTAGDIIKDIVATYMAAEGIDTTNVQDGPTIEKAVFNYIYASDCFDELCTLTGYSWYIDYYKRLYFHAAGQRAAPISITDTSKNYRNLWVDRDRIRYRNRQYIRAGKDVSDERTENFVGDGTGKTFSLTLPCAQVPAITVNSVEKTVGIRQVESGKDWYWSKDEREITQDDAGSALGPGDTLAVTYRGLFPILAVNQLDEEIDARKAIEFGSGIYEAIDEDTSIDERGMAVNKANALLRRYGSMMGRITFETDEEGLRAGQVIDVSLTHHNVSGEYLIESVHTSEIDDAAILRASVSAVSGEAVGGWTKFFQALQKATRTFVLRENEVLIRLRWFTETITVRDEISTSTGSPESRVGYARVGYSEIGA